MISKKIIEAYTLKNAVEHNGAATLKPILNSLFSEGLQKEHIKETSPIIQEILENVNALSLKEQQEKFDNIKETIGKRPERDGLQSLDDTKKGIVTRFSPSPSGPMHIGHILTSLLSELYVREYGGKFYFRIEDTNPENIEPKAYRMLEDEAKWLYTTKPTFIIQSDRIATYHKTAEKLIEKGAAYICTCNPETFKTLIIEKKACPCRSLSTKEQKGRWVKMQSTYKQGEAVLRFKADLTHSNPAFRDFPLARINTHEHPRTKHKYRVWPLMNLAVTTDDIEEKMTHIIRGKDHKDNAVRQKMIYKALGKETQFPHVFFIGRYKFTDLELSATKTREAITSGKYTGWDDIRLPTLASLKKRGFQPETFAQLVIERGLTEADKVITQRDFFDLLGRINREHIREKATEVSFTRTTHEKANASIKLPDGRRIYGTIEVKPKKETIYYFSKHGYAQYNRKVDSKYEFWYAHP